MNGDTNETKSIHLQTTNNRRRAFFHDDVIRSDNQINSIGDEPNEDNSLHDQDINTTNKSFKRKAVSFSAMPFEKKVADGKKQKEMFNGKEKTFL